MAGKKIEFPVSDDSSSKNTTALILGISKMIKLFHGYL